MTGGPRPSVRVADEKKKKKKTGRYGPKVKGGEREDGPVGEKRKEGNGPAVGEVGWRPRKRKKSKKEKEKG